MTPPNSKFLIFSNGKTPSFQSLSNKENNKMKKRNTKYRNHKTNSKDGFIQALYLTHTQTVFPLYSNHTHVILGSYSIHTIAPLQLRFSAVLSYKKIAIPIKPHLKKRRAVPVLLFFFSKIVCKTFSLRAPPLLFLQIG